MTQPLHFTPKAIADLSEIAVAARFTAPGTSEGVLYLIDKLRAAQVFVLSDSGQLLDRSKPRPELPGVVLRPPFPVVALEYLANPADWADPVYTASSCSKRISLAWNNVDDLPPTIEAMIGRPLGPGVIIASIAFYDEHQKWMPVAVAMHVDYEEDWVARSEESHFHDAMVAAGRITPATARARTLPGSAIPISPETVFAGAATLGAARTMDMMGADLMDETAAFMDLCWALACKNVSIKHREAPARLNAQRVKAGKPPLHGFHVLELAGEAFGGDARGGHHASPRSHLRRGHIRRLGADRVTWVNQSMVRGRGFVDKVYAL